jgi:hypothetical protein
MTTTAVASITAARGRTSNLAKRLCAPAGHAAGQFCQLNRGPAANNSLPVHDVTAACQAACACARNARSVLRLVRCLCV